MKRKARPQRTQRQAAPQQWTASRLVPLERAVRLAIEDLRRIQDPDEAERGARALLGDVSSRIRKAMECPKVRTALSACRAAIELNQLFVDREGNRLSALGDSIHEATELEIAKMQAKIDGSDKGVSVDSLAAKLEAEED